MKLIPLTQGLFAKVDNEDFEKLNQYKWCAFKDGKTHYAIRAIRKNGKQKFVWMHREIMKAPKGMDVDHKRHNGLDNRKSKLRLCTRSQNLQNTYNPRRKIMYSRYKGVSWHKHARKWIAYIGYNKKLLYLGLFTSEIAAAKVYDKAAIKLFGEFAKINF